MRRNLTEMADGKLVPGVRRSERHAKAQLRESGYGWPFNARVNHGPPDTGGADNVARIAVGEIRKALIGSGVEPMFV